MIAKNVTHEQMEHALHIINEKYSGNVRFNRFDREGKNFRFTLRVSDCRAPGHSLGHKLTAKGNHIRSVSACWHVHGDFFEALFVCNPYAEIRTARATITPTHGNWQDWNAGSIVRPQFMSEKCDCNR